MDAGSDGISCDVVTIEFVKTVNTFESGDMVSCKQGFAAKLMFFPQCGNVRLPCARSGFAMDGTRRGMLQVGNLNHDGDGNGLTIPPRFLRIPHICMACCQAGFP